MAHVAKGDDVAVTVFDRVVDDGPGRDDAIATDGRDLARAALPADGLDRRTRPGDAVRGRGGVLQGVLPTHRPADLNAVVTPEARPGPGPVALAPFVLTKTHVAAGRSKLVRLPLRQGVAKKLSNVVQLGQSGCP